MFMMVFDQGLSTASNAMLVIAVSRNESVATFGEFALAYVVFAFALGIQRAGVADPFLVRSDGSGELHPVDQAHFLRNLMLSAGLGAALLTIIGLFFGGAPGAFLLWLGLAAPAVLAQDGLRYYAMASARPRVTALMDGVWLAVLVGGFLAAPSLDGPGAIRIWGLGALASLLVGLALLRPPGLMVVRRTAPKGDWFSPSFGLEFVFIAGSGLLLLGGLRMVIGPPAAAAIFAVVTVFQPAQSLLGGLRFYYLPRLRSRAGTADYQSEVCRWIVVITLVLLAWLALCLTAQHLLDDLLGDTWALARTVLFAGAAFELASSLTMLLSDHLKVTERGHQLVRGRGLFVGLCLSAALLGGLLDDVGGAAAGRAVGAAVGLAVWFTFVEHRHHALRGGVLRPERPRSRSAVARRPATAR